MLSLEANNVNNLILCNIEMDCKIEDNHFLSYILCRYFLVTTQNP